MGRLTDGLARTLAAVAAGAWGMIALSSAGLAVPSFCSGSTVWQMPDGTAFSTLFMLQSPLALVFAWAVMLAAMMVPVLWWPLAHVRRQGLARLRPRVMGCFVLGYFSVWLAAGLVLVPLALLLRMGTGAPWVMVGMAALVALGWQASPWKQIALNHCHATPPLPGLPPRAFRASLRFGLWQGVWCVASCWALMLTALLVPVGHLAVMALVTFWLWSERVDEPGPRVWRMRWPLKGLRILKAQLSLT